MAIELSISGTTASAKVTKLRGTKNHKSWRQNMHALLLGQGLWKYATGLVPFLITQAEWDSEKKSAKAVTPAKAPLLHDSWQETIDDN
jgi:hypothetical protein